MIELVAYHIKRKRRKPQGVEDVRFPLAYKSLHMSIKKYLGLDIPCQAVCAGHNAPFDVFYDSFTEKTLNCIVIANRGGGKTLNSAALEFVEASEKGLEECHLGAIMAQAKRAYKYIYSWAYKYREKMGINKITIGETLFKNGGSIEIIPGTMNGVNSPHPHKATIDEFELLPWEIFEEAGSMPRSGTNGRAALRLYTTRKKASGNAQLMISEAETRGFRLYKWCIFEVMTPCLSSLPCKKCPYKKHVTFNNEGDKVTWPSVCQGKAKKSRGYI
ncbi:MAG: hypothetical protein U9P50_00295, partial [Patescibacteria group bacterium]|nr:hypothetical protein [Patescibacteria group bacterium]